VSHRSEVFQPTILLEKASRTAASQNRSGAPARNCRVRAIGGDDPPPVQHRRGVGDAHVIPRVLTTTGDGAPITISGGGTAKACATGTGQGRDRAERRSKSINRLGEILALSG
jgi:hypothetical protein